MRIYLETFGCQMNELDSDLVRGQLVALGHEFSSDPNSAEVLLLNTCSVREQAEQKAYSRMGIVGQRKKAGERLLLGVIGCMAERDGLDLFRRFPQVDLLCGPGELDRLPALLDTAIKSAQADPASPLPRPRPAALAGNKSRRSTTLAAAEDDLESLDLSRSFSPDEMALSGRSAYVRITRGCNKFCTYCVVPHTRGAEVHRPPSHIIDECKRLADAGAVEVTLLGQTVNHYRYVHGTALTVSGRETAQVGAGLATFRAKSAASLPDEIGTASGSQGRKTTSFAELLARIHDEVPEIARLRFVTSYPRDFGDDILAVMRDCPRICRYIHAPAQSGSDRILKLMNRGYSVSEYREFIHRVRSYLPDVCIAGDLIVGFPTETESDFDATCDLLREVRYKNNFIFKYSPRPGTAAIDRFPDDVPDEVKRLRNNHLLAVQAEVGLLAHREWVGSTVEIMVQGVREYVAKPTSSPVELGWERPNSPITQHFIIGRTSGDLIVSVPTGNPSVNVSPGQLVKVLISQAGPLLLHGDLV